MDIKHYFIIKVHPIGVAITGLVLSTVLNWICLLTPYWIRAYEVNWPMTALTMHGYNNGKTTFAFNKNPHGIINTNGIATFNFDQFSGRNVDNITFHHNHVIGSNSNHIPQENKNRNNVSSYGDSQSLPYLNSYSDTSGNRTKNKLHPPSANDMFQNVVSNNLSVNTSNYSPAGNSSLNLQNRENSDSHHENLNEFVESISHPDGALINVTPSSTGDDILDSNITSDSDIAMFSFSQDINAEIEHFILNKTDGSKLIR